MQIKVIKIIPASKRKGVNKVFWNMRINPPKVAEGGTKIDFGGLTRLMQVMITCYLLEQKNLLNLSKLFI